MCTCVPEARERDARYIRGATRTVHARAWAVRCLPVQGHLLKAMHYPRYGGADVLEMTEIEVPTPGAGELLVRVLFGSVNPIDWKLASGSLRFLMPVARPAVPGFDVVGQVLTLGPGVTGFSEGQRIVARIDSKTGRASAEQCVVSVAQAVVVPDGISSPDAAALPLAGMTALQALRDGCGMKMTGETARVLVVGASGGVGHYAVQLAVQAGAHVTGVCSTPNVSLVEELGAHAVIDYRKQSDFDTGEPYDIILDCASKADWSVFDAVLAPDGKLALPAPRGTWIARILLSKLTRRTVVPVMLKPNAADLTLLIDMMAKGQLRSVVGAHYPLTELAEAWTANIRGGVQGKIVIEVA
jgi:NADPH:quinone reductase-like Zn-dependent oxidoreductase